MKTRFRFSHFGMAVMLGVVLLTAGGCESLRPPTGPQRWGAADEWQPPSAEKNDWRNLLYNLATLGASFAHE